MTRIDIALARHMADDLNALARMQPDDVLVISGLDSYLRSCDMSLGTYGVEVITDSEQRRLLTYCNTGDPYIATLMFDHQENQFIVACWGCIVEERGY